MTRCVRYENVLLEAVMVLLAGAATFGCLTLKLEVDRSLLSRESLRFFLEVDTAPLLDSEALAVEGRRIAPRASIRSWFWPGANTVASDGSRRMSFRKLKASSDEAGLGVGAISPRARRIRFIVEKKWR